MAPEPATSQTFCSRLSLPAKLIMSAFLNALINLGIPTEVASIVDGQFAKVEQHGQILFQLQGDLQQLREDARAM